MKVITYSFQSAIKSIWMEKWINVLTILSISIGLSILCIFASVSWNLDSLLQRWSKGFGMVVYLSDDAGMDKEQALQKDLMRDPAIIEINYVPKDKALDDIRQTLGADAVILDTFDKNPLPSSFEIKLDRTFLEPAMVRKKAQQIRRISGVQEVQYGEKWLSSLHTVSRSMQVSVIVLGCIIFVAITFITFSTIKIFFYRRKEEVETLKLLGATRGFIRLPFLIEGLIIGIIGGCISSLALFGAYSFTSIKIAQFFPSIKQMSTSLPSAIYVIMPVSGALMSILGSFIAVGKIRY